MATATHVAFEQLLQISTRRSPQKKILILATRRSGSTFFCNSLASTGTFGVPEEWLSPKVLMDFNKESERKISNIRAWWDHVQHTGISENGVFTCKLMVRQYAYWKRHGFNILSTGWDRILWIKRNGFIEQALSLAKARMTDQWHADQAPKGASKKTSVTKQQIFQAMGELASWEEYFNTHLSKYVHDVYIYEDFCQKPELFEEALSRCGIAVSASTAIVASSSIQRTNADSVILSEFRHWLKSKIS